MKIALSKDGITTYASSPVRLSFLKREGFVEVEVIEEVKQPDLEELNSMTAAELKSLAKNASIKGYSNMNKEQLLNALVPDSEEGAEE